MGAAMREPDLGKRAGMVEMWRTWPNAFEMHPEGAAEHFLPLVVAAAAGGEGGAESYKDDFMGLEYWSYYWD